MLGCYANQKAITIGTPTANRSQPELEHLIGFFVNMLVLNIDTEPNQLLASYFQKVSTEIIGAQSNQIPFEKLVTSLAVEKDTSRNPIFQVIFNLVNHGNRQEKSSVFTAYDPLENKRLFETTAKYDLEISLYNNRSCIIGYFAFYTRIFHREAIRSFLNSYTTLLTQFAEIYNSNNIKKTALREIEWIDRSQEHKLARWKDEQRVEFCTNTTLHELFENIAEESPSKTAIVCGERSLTYQELNEQANQLAHHLRQKVKILKTHFD